MRYEVKLIDGRDKRMPMERRIEVDGVYSEHVAELHALQEFKGLKRNLDSTGSPFVPNGKVKILSVKEIESIATKEY
jgi:hypothetical protein